MNTNEQKNIRVLVVVDAQEDFIRMSLGSADAQAVVPNIVDLINNADGKFDYIVTTQDTHPIDYLSTKEGLMLPVNHCIAGTKGWEIIPEILQAINKFNTGDPNDDSCNINVIKHGWGSIKNGTDEDLPTVIQRLMDENNAVNAEITLVGFDTDVCVISNTLVLKSYFYNSADIYVDASCCAGITPQKHQHALDVMESCLCHVINK